MPGEERAGDRRELGRHLCACKVGDGLDVRLLRHGDDERGLPGLQVENLFDRGTPPLHHHILPGNPEIGDAARHVLRYVDRAGEEDLHVRVAGPGDEPPIAPAFGQVEAALLDQFVDGPGNPSFVRDGETNEPGPGTAAGVTVYSWVRTTPKMLEGLEGREFSPPDNLLGDGGGLLQHSSMMPSTSGFMDLMS